MTTVCAHFDALVPAEPEIRGQCPECVASGSTWVHLRSCLTCGHVGCCDSSPHRHATAHARLREHVLVQSIEPGESWAYCYADDLLVPGRDVPRR
ncbi:UBP-type zinc finger domain-containing protein [Isoptericola aurantiacus]|uniref:UBP-type zinc finger domain-containing protein n=1 Tax=Isoptericola aurantiacus TaxID=3377839 RepID=UPI00383B43AB